MESNTIIYRDIDQTLKKNYLDNVDDILQSIINILTTTPGELIFDASFGSRLREMLFEPASSTFELELLSEITRAISSYEPRVTLNMSKTKVVIEDKTVWLTLVFNVKNMGAEEFTKEVGFKYEYN